MRKPTAKRSEETPSVLLLGLETSEQSAITSMLREAPFHTLTSDGCHDSGDLMKLASVVISAGSLPDGTWRDVLPIARSFAKPPALIVTSRQNNAGKWAEAINLGAYDVLVKPFLAEEVMWVVRNAHDHHTARWKTSPLAHDES